MCTSSALLNERLSFLQNTLGGVPSPFDCYLVYRSLRTLHIRLACQTANAMHIALMLEQHPKVAKVIYPGLKSHPQHELAQRQQSGFGSMISIVLRGTLEDACRFTKATRIFQLAESLGGVKSLLELPAIMTHGSVSPEIRAALGITDTFVRLSVGLRMRATLLTILHRPWTSDLVDAGCTSESSGRAI